MNNRRLPHPATEKYVGDVTVAVIIVAAGSGSRLGNREPKAFVPVGGVTLLERSVRSVAGMAEPVQVIVVAPEGRLEDARRLASRGSGASVPAVVAGGATRQQSVAAGLATLDPGIEIVLVHDSARALTPPTLMDAVVAAVRGNAVGVVPGLPVADTIKRLDVGLAVETVDRTLLSAVQTPQGFPRDQLMGAYARADAASVEYTDDAAVFAAAGLPVLVIEGDPLAFKITTPWDLGRAESLLQQPVGFAAAGAKTVFRTGIGIDVHAYDDMAPLWLGGLFWPGEAGLAGHSDGDAVAHAICDALLSAASLGDIGGTFGTDDPRFADAHGDVFLRATLALVAEAGYRVHNVAVQIVGNRPRLAHRRVEVEQHLGAIVGAPVSVSATTTDGLGFTGRGEGLSAVATALLGGT